MSKTSFVAFLLVFSTLTPPLSAGTWETRAPMPSARAEMGSAVLDGRIWVCGGFSEPFGEPLATCEAYDPAADTWDASVADLPEGFDHGKMAAVDGRLYFLGGGAILFGTNSDAVFEYDPDVGAWNPNVAPMPQARWAPSVGVHDGKIYVIGGENIGGIDTTSLLEFTPPDPSVPGDLGSWRDLGVGIPEEVNHHAADVIAGKLYVISGRDEQNVNRFEAWEFDLTQDPVRAPVRRGDIPTARGGIDSSVLWGRIHVIGGEFFNPDGTNDEHERLDPQSVVGQDWSTAPPMPTARHGLIVETVGDEIFVIGGGPTAGLDTSSLNEVYVPGVPVCLPPVLELSGTTVCDDDPVSLDASATTFPGCADPGMQRWVWEDDSGATVGVGSMLELPSPEFVFTDMRLVAWCENEPECVATREFQIEKRFRPLPEVEGPTAACEGERLLLDGRPTNFINCAAGDEFYRWEDADGNIIGTGRILDTGPLAPGEHTFVLVAWCDSAPECEGALPHVVTVRAETPAPATGTGIRVRRDGDDLQLTWPAVAADLGGYEVVALDAPAVPRSSAFDNSSRIIASRPPFEFTATVSGEIGNGTRLTFFKLRGLSSCELVPGTTCDGSAGQAPCD